MTWIRFGPNEPAAPALSGAIDLRGRKSQVVFFGHGGGCKACGNLAQRLVAHRRAWSADLNAEVILASPAPYTPAVFDGHSLIDRGGVLRDRYARLLEFDVSGCLFLFVLDQHGAPFAAWVGAEAPEADVIGETANWLAFAERQCPE